jgi:DNA (cytosine-5)-methyltransferase 1
VTAYYNENDPFAAAWLRELIKDRLVAPGEVDTRSICDVTGADLRGFAQVHFFAGIGGWSYALRLVGWPDDKPVWTGSCPCQPFSAAGKQKGTADKRHLWPDMRRLIRDADEPPATIFGEQVASRLGREWLAGIRADLEALGYGVGAVDLCAAGVGAPHIRQRLYWMADSKHAVKRPECKVNGDPHRRDGLGRCCDVGGLADSDRQRSPREHTLLREGDGRERRASSTFETAWSGADRRLGNNNNAGLEGRRLQQGECADQLTPWSSSTLIPCADGKARRAEPGIFPLAHGVPNRVGTLRGAGNAIVPQVAATFIRAAYFSS